jgi:hypothetical protein
MSQNLLDTLSEFELSEILESEPLRGHIAMLNHGDFAPWKGAVYKELCRFVLETHSFNGHLDGRVLQNGACKILKTHLHHERLFLVGMAVWKAQCQSDVGKLGVFECLEWLASGWKTNKTKQRKSNAMDIIVQCVCPFLE